MTKEKFINYLNFNCKVAGKEVWLSIMPYINKLLDEYEAKLEAKDEYIKTLECRAYHAEEYISDLHNNPSVKRFYDKKSLFNRCYVVLESKRTKALIRWVCS